MYNFIFFFFYSLQIHRDRSEAFSMFNAFLFVGLTVVIHLGFMFAMIRSIFFHGTQGYGIINKGTQGLIVMFLFISVRLYYNKNKVKQILEANNGVLLQSTFSNIVKVLLITLVPMIILIILSPHK